MIAEYRGIMVGSDIPPSYIESVSQTRSMRTGFLFGRQIATAPNTPNWTARINVTTT